MIWRRHPKETDVKPLPPRPARDKSAQRDVERAAERLEDLVRRLEHTLGSNGA